jgi:hypothetical protein
MNSEGEVRRGDVGYLGWFDQRMSDWIRDVGRERTGVGESAFETKKEMSRKMLRVESNFEGYWCQGLTCQCSRSHWVMNESKSNCWDCLHDPCACLPPLLWDEVEQAYYRIGDDSTVWMSEPRTHSAKLEFQRREKKRKKNDERVREHDECAHKQEEAQKKGFCCHHHAGKYTREEEEETRKKIRLTQVDGQYHCIHCDEDPCVFVQIESRLGENDRIHYNEDDFTKAPVAYNSSRRKRAFRYAASILFEGVNYRRQHFTCVENGVRALFPPLDGKIMGYKNK